MGGGGRQLLPPRAEFCVSSPPEPATPEVGTPQWAAPAPPGGEKVGVCVGGWPNFLSRSRAASGGSRKTLCVDGIRDRRTDGCPGREGELRGGPAHTASLSGPREGGSQCRLFGGSGRTRPRRGQENRPSWAPLWDLAGPGGAGLKPLGFDPSPRGVLGPTSRPLCLFLGPGHGNRPS